MNEKVGLGCIIVKLRSIYGSLQCVNRAIFKLLPNKGRTNSDISWVTFDCSNSQDKFFKM